MPQNPIANLLQQPAPLRRRAVALLNDMAGLILLLLPAWGVILYHWTPSYSAEEYAPLQLISVAIAITITYATITGRSYGKKTMGLMIFTRTGQRPTAPRLLLRLITKLPAVISAALCMAWSSLLHRDIHPFPGYDDLIDKALAAITFGGSFLWYSVSLLMLFSARETTLHDLIAGTIVCQAPEPRGFPIEPTKP